ncbi:hypothetical protein [Chelatococcus sp.]|nr:hypothetical protein [Chelatococcus sp.]
MIEVILRLKIRRAQNGAWLCRKRLAALPPMMSGREVRLLVIGR